ncbi:hypothetical protein [Streptomyces sp. NPDC001985]|uniref:hypothetical protein n=1 Tax=Streptomyces sp. NPDC001985 TaxID=3154406 RepID=UPI003325B2E2
MPSYRRLVTALAVLTAGGLLLIGAAAQLARMTTPDTAAHTHKRISDVAPVLAGGSVTGAPAPRTATA